MGWGSSKDSKNYFASMTLSTLLSIEVHSKTCGDARNVKFTAYSIGEMTRITKPKHRTLKVGYTIDRRVKGWN